LTDPPDAYDILGTAEHSPVGGADTSLPLGRTAALVGEYRWIETALFGLLGRWVTDMPVAGVQVHLDGQSLRHAWHAELWGDRLPVLHGVDPDGLTRPSAATAALFAALDGVEPVAVGPGSTWPPADRGPVPRPGVLPRLAGLYRVVLPRLVTSYTRHLQVVAPVADGPLRRVLKLVVNDSVEDWLTGERLIQRLMTRPHDVAAVYEYLEHLEAVAVAAGAHSGLVDLSDRIPAD
jgi:hypothetical protein